MVNVLIWVCVWFGIIMHYSFSSCLHLYIDHFQSGNIYFANIWKVFQNFNFWHNNNFPFSTMCRNVFLDSIFVYIQTTSYLVIFTTKKNHVPVLGELSRNSRVGISKFSHYRPFMLWTRNGHLLSFYLFNKIKDRLVNSTPTSPKAASSSASAPAPAVVKPESIVSETKEEVIATPVEAIKTFDPIQGYTCF